MTDTPPPHPNLSEDLTATVVVLSVAMVIAKAA